MSRSETEDPLCPSCLLEEGVFESSDCVLPGTVVGHFEVKEKIGQGGMGAKSTWPAIASWIA